MTRIIFHIDVNSAYLSWTAISLLKKGEPTDLRTIPSIIGGGSSRHCSGKIYPREKTRHCDR